MTMAVCNPHLNCTLGRIKSALSVLPCRMITTQPKEDIPRITVPPKLLAKLESIKRKQKAAVRRKNINKNSQLIISCKRKEYNHHKGQIYNDFNPQCLCSHGWNSKKSKGDYFTINAFELNPAFKEVADDEEKSHVQFADLGIHSRLLEGLAQSGVKHPTVIQELTIPAMLTGNNVLCAAQTGCGKTLAYLLPIMHQLQSYIEHYGRKQSDNQPLSIIVTPSRELTDQIYDVAYSLAEKTNIIVHSVCGGRGTKKLIRRRERNIMDMLITTPDILRKLTGARQYDVSCVHHLVLDEGDSLLDDSFVDTTRLLLNRVKVQGETVTGEAAESILPPGTQLCIVGATMPRNLNKTLGDIVPVDSLDVVTTPNLHRLMGHVPQKFIRLGPSQKPGSLVEHCKSVVRQGIQTIVFCNTTESSYHVKHTLENNGITPTIINGRVPEKVRQGQFQQFQDGLCHILVCTDIASRGLDTVKVKHIINYDFPTNMSDYIHRVGRVGRVGSNSMGYVINYVTYRWDVDLVWQIETSTRKLKMELENVNANIKGQLIRRLEAQEMHQQQMS